jgi:arylsulfatase
MRYALKRHTNIILTTCLALFLPGLSARAAEKPNIVVILADDMGYSDLGCYGGEIGTPHLDHLAARGLRFTQFYNTARCWPSRAALLTGYYAQQVNRDPADTRPAWAAILPQLLKSAGYQSYHSGKWHVDGTPLGSGFDHSYMVDGAGDHFGPLAHHIDDRELPRPKPDGSFYSTTSIAGHAVKWLKQHQTSHQADPFFLYMAFTAPHFPLHALAEDIARHRDDYHDGWDVIRDRRWKRQKSLGIYEGLLPPPDPSIIPGWNLKEAEMRKRIGPGEVGRAVPWDTLTAAQKSFQATKMSIHAAMIDRIDREVGRVLKQLESMGAVENTVILFASDNGASAEQMIRSRGHDPAVPPGSTNSYLCLGPGWATAADTPFRLHKHYVHEGGISTPLIVSWPKGIKGRGELRHTPGHLIDIAPTLLELAGAKPPETWNDQKRPPMPGHSLIPAFEKDVVIPRDFIYFSHVGNRALRVGDLKVVAEKASAWELYDLSKDRGEMHNLAAEKPEKLKEMVALWQRLDDEYRAQGKAGPRMPDSGS